MESQNETEWFLSKVDSQGRVTIDKALREHFKIEHQNMVWVKVKKT